MFYPILKHKRNIVPPDCEINKACGKPTAAKEAVKILGMDKCQELIDNCSKSGESDLCDCMWYAIFGGIGAQ